MDQPDPFILLWRKMLQGDKNALELIYKQFNSELFHYALKISGQKNIAEDAIQDTFIYIWNQRNRIGVVRSVKFYLIRSVRNQCLKLLQKDKRYANLDELEIINMVIQPEELVLVDASVFVKKRIEKALQSLSPRQKEIIFLKFYNNLDYEEIAAILGINYQSVVNHIHRAIVKLRNSGILNYLDL